MSRTPARPYGYATHAAVIPSNYYYDEAEGYVGDYAEPAAMPEGPHLMAASPDVTEIYRRKASVSATPEHYRPEVYVPAEYYYEGNYPTHMAHVRRPAPSAYRRRIPVDQTIRYFAEPLEDGYDTLVYRSSPQISAVRRTSPARAPSATVLRPTVRRHPVTVRTPRYYRRTANVYKKPSTLCLPVGCQPDPAVYRRARRAHHEPAYANQDGTYTEGTFQNQEQYNAALAASHARHLDRRPSVPVPSPESQPSSPKQAQPEDLQQVDSKGNLKITNSALDAMLARYEKILEDKCPEGQMKPECSPSKTNMKVSPSKNKIVPIALKPKVPSTVKARQERIHKLRQVKNHRESPKHSRQNSPKNSEKFEVEEMTTEVLDGMLCDLMNSGCENKINKNVQPSHDEQTKTIIKPEKDYQNECRSEPADNKCQTSMQSHASFNYQDICQNMSKHQDRFPQQCDVFSQHNSKTIQPQSNLLSGPGFVLERPLVSLNGSRRPFSPVSSSRGTGLDESSAMELHRSKSYIVNLIDRALSKELGTPPEEKFSNKEFVHMDPRSAIDNMINRQSKIDKEFSMEISHAMGDAMLTNTSIPQGESRNENYSTTEEPAYVKQLKQLRWGHLRHIQREVRRLEDLERFLDMYSAGSFT